MSHWPIVKSKSSASELGDYGHGTFRDCKKVNWYFDFDIKNVGLSAWRVTFSDVAFTFSFTIPQCKRSLKVHLHQTRMHSSRMRTARSLTISHSICHTCPSPCTPPPCTPPWPHIPPITHTPYHARPLPHTPPPTMHAPRATHTPITHAPHHARPPPHMPPPVNRMTDRQV